MKKFFFLVLIIVMVCGITYQIFRDDIGRYLNMARGDDASHCAAVFATHEPSTLGKISEFIVFINLVDPSEDELARFVRFFHTLATEYYIKAGESDEASELDDTAALLADYTIMNRINEIHDVIVKWEEYDDYREKEILRCTGIKNEIEDKLSVSN